MNKYYTLLLSIALAIGLGKETIFASQAHEKISPEELELQEMIEALDSITNETIEDIKQSMDQLTEEIKQEINEMRLLKQKEQTQKRQAKLSCAVHSITLYTALWIIARKWGLNTRS